jgi:hypothetical protein
VISKDLKQAVDQQHSDELMKVAHACKSSPQSVRSTSPAEVSCALELMERKGILDGAVKNFEELLKEKDRTTHAL